ncbi:DUF7662 domain-containing protein [Robertmurraya siralis]|uniref:DUF7662 domain-containing protein n=1 Tax=Robertmurraya siralis TaxID=77777 RepID=UPI0010F509AA|nr:hypothetical protein [Robertmurraya siralis]
MEYYMYHGKYLELHKYLLKVKEDSVVLSYEEMEIILGFKLPNSASKYVEWWDNNTHNHTQARAWRTAGWYTGNIKLGESVKFYK